MNFSLCLVGSMNWNCRESDTLIGSRGYKRLLELLCGEQEGSDEQLQRSTS